VNPTSVPDIGQPESSHKCRKVEPYSLQKIYGCDFNTRLSSMSKTENWLKNFGIVTRGQAELGAYS
jgi:hypothetical protein